jgi:predicted RNA-binding Zn-ribbon protein involved in translation (DUF1610 family)
MLKRLLLRLIGITLTVGSITPLCDSCGYKAKPLGSLRKASDLLGMTCPKCGAVMITQEDVDKIKALSKLTGESIVSDESFEEPETHEPMNRDSVRMCVKMNSHDMSFGSPH